MVCLHGASTFCWLGPGFSHVYLPPPLCLSFCFSQDRAKVEMDAVAYVEHGGTLAGGSVQVDGDLRLRQAWPLSVYGGGFRRGFSSIAHLLRKLAQWVLLGVQLEGEHVWFAPTVSARLCVWKGAMILQSYRLKGEDLDLMSPNFAFFKGTCKKCGSANGGYAKRRSFGSSTSHASWREGALLTSSSKT